MVIKIIGCLLVGYLIGCISTGYLVGRSQNMDIRDHGSGNAGTTNAFRTMGKKAGIITLLGDFFKAFIPIAIMRYFIWPGEDYLCLMELILGFGCVLGHNFPFWLHFKGGKGIAVTGGAFTAIDHILFIPGVIIFGGLILITKYVSVASMTISVAFAAWIAVTRYGQPYYVPCLCVALLYTISAFYSHRSNLKRLANGTENKVGHKKPAEAQEKA